jgi:hypothetical protein
MADQVLLSRRRAEYWDRMIASTGGYQNLAGAGENVGQKDGITQTDIKILRMSKREYWTGE